MHGPPVEQAIFTSVRGREMDGYQLVATSPGVTSDEAKELSVWGPAHDSLSDARRGAQSVNFHRLESGRFCVSQTTALDAEYSGRGGCQVYTHYLVVGPETLLQFANDPFRLLDAALAAGKLELLRVIPDSLEAFPLLGGASAMNASLVTRLSRELGAATLAHWVDIALTSQPLTVVSRTASRRLAAGLLSLLPRECRTEFSFTTGLRPSPRRPFRIAVLGEHAGDEREANRGSAVTIDLDNMATTARPPSHGWAKFVAGVLAENGVSQLATVFREPRSGLTTAGLSELAGELAASVRSAAAAVN